MTYLVIALLLQIVGGGAIAQATGGPDLMMPLWLGGAVVYALPPLLVLARRRLLGADLSRLAGPAIACIWGGVLFFGSLGMIPSWFYVAVGAVLAAGAAAYLGGASFSEANQSE
jgi:hypothetical protein